MAFGVAWFQSHSPRILSHHTRYDLLVPLLMHHYYSRCSATTRYIIATYHHMADTIATVDAAPLLMHHWRLSLHYANVSH